MTSFFTVVNERDDALDTDETWAISLDGSNSLWETDGGFSGYGLTRGVAVFLCMAANKEIEEAHASGDTEVVTAIDEYVAASTAKKVDHSTEAWQRVQDATKALSLAMWRLSVEAA